MNIFDQAVYEAAVKRNESHPACNFTETVLLNGKSYSYMSEVDPHHDDPFSDVDAVWTIRFIVTKPDFFFVYQFNGQQYAVEPELNKDYSFNFRELHAYLHKDNVQHFDNEAHWVDFEPTAGLACVFEFISKS